jgi:hypothetical protein
MIRFTSIIIPIIREQQALECIDSIHRNAGVSQSRYEILAELDKDRIGCPKMVKMLTGKARFGLVMFLGDDTRMEPDCLKNALSAIESLPDKFGMVGLNDGHFGEELATHWLADKRLLPLIGGEFFHTGYRHCFCDWELIVRCKELSRYIWAEDARIVHLNPIITGGSADPNDYPGYLRENFMRDKVLYHTRRRNSWQ